MNNRLIMKAINTFQTALLGIFHHSHIVKNKTLDVIAFEEYIHNAQAFKIYQGTGISSLSSNLAISSFVIQHEILVRTNKNTFG